MNVRQLVGALAASTFLHAMGWAQPAPTGHAMGLAQPTQGGPSMDLANPIPADPALRTGKLSNGLTYYIRRNEEPAGRVLLYLVNNVGSVLEDEDQRGLAHFMEHMNFNGTKHFPKNELEDYLQKAGVTFGADLNAYTSFDETVYELPISTDRTDSGLQILRDWAQDALLDSVELQKERGVVLEEERLGKGAKERTSRQIYPIILNHSRYADRLPIGLDSVLVHFQRPVIDRFRHDWYRPDLQAVIVVGDVDVDKMEKDIRRLFGDLRNPAPERPRIRYAVALTGENQFKVITDPEETATTIELLYKHEAPGALRTGADYKESMVRSLFNQMLSDRRASVLSRLPDPGFSGVSASIEGLMGGVDAFAFDVTVRQGQMEKGFHQAWRFLEQVKRYGFTDGELERAKRNYLRSQEESLKEKNKTPSINFVKEYQRAFLQGEATPGIAWEYAFAQKHVDSITLGDIDALMHAYLTDINRDILVIGPGKEMIAPAKESAAPAILQWMQDTTTLEPYQDDAGSVALMPVKPGPGKVSSVKTIPSIGVTEATLGNGVKLVLKPTDFRNDEIGFRAFASGGTSLYDDSDYDAAASAAQLVGAMGLGELSPVALTKALAGKSLKVAPYMDARFAGLTGSTSTEDLETALQAVHLYFTQPRMDSLLFHNILGNSRSALEGRYANPVNAYSDTIAYVMGNYAYRNSPPWLEKLDRITLDKTLSIYRQRFGDASEFTFVFVGHFSVDSLLPLLAQYLGTLPALHKKEQARDLGIHIPPGKMDKTVYGGNEDKATVRLVYSGNYVFSPQANMELQALGQILQIKLLQHLREDEGEVYSPQVQTVYNKLPKNRYALIVTFGCAPRNADHLSAMVQQEMDSIRSRGPLAEDVQKYKAAYARNLELALKDNGVWLSYLTGQLQNEEGLTQILDNRSNLDKVSEASLQKAAQTFFDGKNCIRFALLPESLK